MLRYVGDGLAMPGHAVLDANLSTSLPRFAWASNRSGLATSGSGLADDGLRRALGEYFERRHFYREVRGESTGDLSTIEDEELREALSAAFQQTASENVRGRIADHVFALSTVLKLPTFEPVNAPTILFSVTGESLGRDGEFFMSRDTMGCAAHFDLLRAMDGAVREFAERQYLLRYWLTGRGARDVTSAVTGQLSAGARGLFEKLGRSGSIRFLEISRDEISGAVVLAVYQGSRDPLVRYCVGLCCDAHASAAADRAVKELWQSYVFLRNMVNKADVDRLVRDRYHTYFIECNTRQTAEAMLAGIDGPADDALRGPVGNLSASIQARFRHLLCYAKQVLVVSRHLWCVRVVSPDAFLHMDNSRLFNLRCEYANAFSDAVIPSRLKVMVPFP